jgi:hypothetical protein
MREVGGEATAHSWTIAGGFSRLDSLAAFLLRSYHADRIPPFDRAIALVCSMRTLRGRWINVRCRCGHCIPHPVRLMLRETPECADRTLADVLVGMRCRGCGGRRLTLHLCEDGHGVGALPKAIAPGWALLLHDAAGPDLEPGKVMAAE